jgi:hypothetical protein
MKFDRDSLFGIVFWIAFGGLIAWGYQAATDKKAEKASTSTESRANRKQAVQNIIKAGPQTTSWETPQGTVIALDVPKATLGGRFIETKHCIVWRDAVTKTSALHCDKDEIDTRDYPYDPPETDR